MEAQIFISHRLVGLSGPELPAEVCPQIFFFSRILGMFGGSNISFQTFPEAGGVKEAAFRPGMPCREISIHRKYNLQN